MIDISKIDYALLDRPEILMYLFHPRPEFGRPVSASEDKDIMLKISGANHNDILFHGLKDYLAAVRKLTESLKSGTSR
jgi:hypothetical protein